MHNSITSLIRTSLFSNQTTASVFSPSLNSLEKRCIFRQPPRMRYVKQNLSRFFLLCLHQVRNYAPCVKLAVDFLLPEALPACLEIARELRLWRLSTKSAMQDVLELNRQILFSCLYYQQLLQLPSSSIIAAEDEDIAVSVIPQRYRCPWCRAGVPDCNGNMMKKSRKWKPWINLREHMYVFSITMITPDFLFIENDTQKQARSCLCFWKL